MFITFVIFIKKEKEMFTKKMEEAINQQIVREMYSSNLYLAMASYFHSHNLNGFANWMRVQAQEETMHATKFFDYIISRSGKAKIGKIEGTPCEWESPLKAFEDAFEHEKFSTQSINDLADVALEEKDHATMNMLNWFIDEQVEEEANTSEIVDRLKLIADSKSGLFMMDNELKTRQLSPATV